MDKSTVPLPGQTPPVKYTWTVNSTGTSGNVTRQVSQTIDYIPGVHQDVSFDYTFGLFVGAPPAGTNPPCLITLHGNVSVTANVYIGGNLCTQGGVQMTPKIAHTLGVYVYGFFNGNGNGTIGTSALPFAVAQINGGCGATNPVACSSQTNVFADSTSTANFQILQKPTVDPTSVYNTASSWANKCTGAANFVLDDTPPLNQSSGTGNQAQELFPNQDYSCTVPKTDGSTATMTWNHSAHTFNIVGSMFIDGDLKMSPGGNNDVNWTGDGSIYVNGTVTKGSNNNFCGPPTTGSGPTGFGCPQTWAPPITRTNSTITSGSTTVTVSSTAGLTAGLYVDGTGIPFGTTIASITNGTTLVLSAPATASSGTATLKFTKGNFGLVILNPTAANTGFGSNGNGEFDMNLYVVSGFANTGGTVVTGSVMADGGDIGGGTGLLNPQDPPPDFPTTVNLPAVGWSPAPGNWKELK